ncbi:MAG TPA: MarC family protein [Variovorax sp.]
MTSDRIFVARLLVLVPGLLLPLAAFAGRADSEAYRLGTSQIFTLFFITLGPLKLLGPFARATQGLDVRELRQLAWKAMLIGLVALVAGGFIGEALMAKWTIPQGALRLTAGLVFFLVALKAVLAPYNDSPAPQAAQGSPRAMKIAFPMLVTPYGIAAVIVLLATAQDAQRIVVTLAMLLLVMAMNLLSMIFVRTVMKPTCVAVLQVLGAVLGLLQVALSIYIMLGALYLLGLVSTPV